MSRMRDAGAEYDAEYDDTETGDYPGSTAEAGGHRIVPHLPGVRIEAWGRNREECLIEALCGLVESFADVSGVRPIVVDYVRLADGPDEDLLIGLLTEVIVRLDVESLVPVDAEAEVVEGGVGVRLAMADLDDVLIRAPTPKAVALHRVWFAPGPRRCACSFVVDG